MKLAKFLPILSWAKTYSKQDLKGDSIAGLTVGVMLIPQGMAYAMLAGMPPIYGLYAATIPLFLYAILGTSRQLAVGPVAMVSLLTAAGIGTIAEAGTETYIALAITLAFMVGVMQLLLGIFRLGFLVNFLSHPVISGFASAAALIIGFSQLKHLLGVEIPRSHHIHEIVLNIIEQGELINWFAFMIGIVGIFIIKGVKKLHPSIPGPLVIVVLGILAVVGLGLSEKGVKIVGEVPQGLPAFSAPEFSFETFEAIFPIALAIALIGFMQSIAVVKAIQKKHKGHEVRPNQELIALGLANIGGSFFLSYPTTGGFARTAVNDQMGAKTGFAAIISASLIILTLLFLTPLFYFLPKAILASIIMVAVIGLIDIKEAFHLWKSDRTDFWMLIATFVGTLAFGIEQGIALGVALSLAMVIMRTTRPHIAELGRVPNTPFYRNVRRFKQVEQRDDLLIIRFDGQLYFANIAFFKETLNQWVDRKGDSLKAIIIHAESISQVDSSAIHALKEIVTEYRDREIKMLFASVIGPVRDAFQKGGIIPRIGKNNFFMSVQKAVDHWDQNHQDWVEPDFIEYTLQADGEL